MARCSTRCKVRTKRLNIWLASIKGRPVSAFLAEPESKGRFFYNEDVSGFNFVQVNTRLDQVFSKLLSLKDEPHPTVALRGVNTDQCLVTWL